MRCDARTPRPARPAELAVLYFETDPSDRGVSHVACGLTEEVITRLARSGALSVASRKDVLAFRGRDVGTDALGECTGVEYVLRGDVSAFHDRIRSDVRLSGVGRADDLWRESFESAEEGLAGLAPAVAAGTLRELGGVLEPSEEKRVREPLTESAKAWELHAHGREELTLRGRRHTESAIRYFEEAVSLDPRFAAAYESLAAACSGMYTYYDGADRWLERMTDAANRALELDRNLVEARFHLGMVALHRRQYDSARAALEEIVRERPGYYEAYLWLGILSDMTGRHEEALVCYRKGAEVKPCSVEPWLYINMTHRRRGDFAGATDAARKFLEVGLRTLRVVPDDPVTLSRFCVIYTLSGEVQKAQETLRRILRSGTSDGQVLYNCAATYALMGAERESLDCLRRALGEGYKSVRDWLEADPDFDRIREGDGFRTLLCEFDRLHRGKKE